MAPGTACRLALGALGLVVVACSHGGGLVRRLPTALPSIEGWEKSSGWGEFEHPHRFAEYELYVDPKRTATYAVVHYRITLTDAAERRANRSFDDEKLQWDVNGHLRRFECSRPAAATRGCEWHELAAESPEYKNELAVILWLYSFHSRLLHEREGR